MEKDALVTSNRIKLEKEARTRRWHTVCVDAISHATLNHLNGSAHRHVQAKRAHFPYTNTRAHALSITYSERAKERPSGAQWTNTHTQCENAKNLQFISNCEIEFFPEGYLNVIIKKFASLLHFFLFFRPVSFHFGALFSHSS